jgi:HSP20 family molecular chaperone IbpA
MTGLFRKKKKEFIINEPKREWIDSAFVWLYYTFNWDLIKKNKVLVPNYEDFPIVYNEERDCIEKTLRIVATQMGVSPDDIHLDIYNEGQTEISIGGTRRLFLNNVEGENYSSGLYWGKQNDGKYHIGLEISESRDPEKIVAILAHEIAHIKLLGEEKIEKNIETLTDLTTVIFGLGIFNANAAFKFEQDTDYWRYSKVGYLTQMEWAYSLALFAYLKQEKAPNWINYLTPNIKSDFIKSERFISENKEIILRLDLEQKGSC